VTATSTDPAVPTTITNPTNGHNRQRPVLGMARSVAEPDGDSYSQEVRPMEVPGREEVSNQLNA
jgi:hypothetical protein